jgi:hypothetical protein
VLPGGGVGLLDDLGEVAVLVADDAAVAVGVGHTRGERGDGVALLLVGGHELGERGAAQERGVTAGQDHGAAELGAHGGQVLDRHAHGVSGAVLFLLDRGGGLGGDHLQVCPDLLAGVSYDHDRVLGVEFSRRREHVAEHAAAVELVKDFGKLRLHSGALARREDDDGSRTVHAHRRGPLVNIW